MKKLIILLAVMVAFAINVDAQMKTSNINTGNTYVEVDTDYTLTNAVTQYWQINAPQNWHTAQYLVVNLDSLAGNHTSVTLQLYGRLNSVDTWAAIGSAVAWDGTTSDTTIVYSNTTENAYRQYKLLYTGVGTGTTTIDFQSFKQFFGDL